MRFPRRIRLAAEAYSNPENVFHVVIHAHPEVRRFSFETQTAIWTSLMESAKPPDVILHAAVLMPDHVHLVVQAAGKDVVSWVGAWKSRSARATWRFGIRGTPWQPRFYDRALRGEAEYASTMEYVLRNPSTAGLVEDDELWPFRWVMELE